MNKHTFSLQSDLLLNKQDENFLSRKRVKLLENIMVYGSISKAAKASAITYKTAWEWIDKMNTLSPKPLVQTLSGGKGGGGTLVTVYAKELLRIYEEVQALHQKHLQGLQGAFEHLEDDIQNKTFSFSRLNAELVETIIHGKNATLILRLECGSLITTQASDSFVEVNALKTGSPISVLIEAEAISVSKFLDEEISSRNKLKTRVEDLTIEGDDVLLRLFLGKDQYLTSRITLKSCRDLQIEVGSELIAMFKAYSATLFCKKSS